MPANYGLLYNTIKSRIKKTINYKNLKLYIIINKKYIKLS